MVFLRPVPRLLVAAGLLSLSLSACGRRGALEPPPNPSAPQAEQSSQSDDETLPSPIGTPRRSNAREPFVKPKQPVILDPIL
jgi:predicted small lipoprotein YifL